MSEMNKSDLSWAAESVSEEITTEEGNGVNICCVCMYVSAHVQPYTITTGEL